MSDIKELFPYESNKPVKTVQQVFEPYILKYGVEPMQAILNDLYKEGYKIHRASDIEEVIKAFKTSQAVIESYKGLVECQDRSIASYEELIVALKATFAYVPKPKKSWWSWFFNGDK